MKETIKLTDIETYTLSNDKQESDIVDLYLTKDHIYHNYDLVYEVSIINTQKVNVKYEDWINLKEDFVCYSPRTYNNRNNLHNSIIKIDDIRLILKDNDSSVVTDDSSVSSIS